MISHPVRREGVYRLLLRMHPRAFRVRYEAELLACFREGWRSEAEGRGWFARSRFWRKTVVGTLTTAWRQRTGTDGRPTKQRVRRVHGNRVGAALGDLKVGWRSLRRRPGWAAVVVLTLGLGIGATMAVFSIFHAVIVAPLPWPDGDRLVRVYLRNVVNGSDRLHLSAPAAAELRDQSSSFAAVGFLQDLDAVGVNITDGDRPERLRALRVNREYFAALGPSPRAGRIFEHGEETGDARVAVVTTRVADRFLGGAVPALRRSVTLDGVAYSVVGVVDDAVRDPLAGVVDVWLPVDLVGAANRTWQNNYLDAFARLAPGTSIDDARAELAVLTRRHRDMGPAAAEKAYTIVSLKDDLVGSTRPLLLALTGAVAFLLVLTCTNVASLFLARAATRERELAIRTTLGSTRRDLVRSFTIESCLVAMGGGVVGLGVGRLGLDLLLAVAPADLPFQHGVGLGWGAALGAGALALGVGSVLGIVTAWPSSRPDLGAALAEGGRAGQGGVTARRARTTLVIVDVALAVVLLVGAGVLLRTLHALQNRDLGIDATGVVAFDVHLPETDYPTPELRIGFHAALHERLASLPGVAAAGATSHLPVTGSRNTWGTRRAAAVGDPFDDDNIAANQRIADGAYFDAIGARLLAGRLFDERDAPGAPHAVVVNESLARTLFGGDDPLGQFLKVGPLYPTIVGVIADIALTARIGSAPMVFHAYPQFGAGRRWPITHVVRVASDVPPPWDGIRAAVSDVDPTLVVHALRTLQEVVTADIGDERFAALLLQSFAGLALLVASLGLYGILAHAVERRRHEIGVRMALGADGASVVGMVLRHGVGLTVAGTALGLGGALALTRTLDFLVFGVSVTDPVVYVAVTGLLITVATAASYLPALRATRVHPASALDAS